MPDASAHTKPRQAKPNQGDRNQPRRRVNQHGRKPGRGLRPWLLIPKLTCVCGLVGGLAAAFLLTATHAPTPDTLDSIHTLILGLVVPCGVLAYALGIALMLQHPDVLPHQRWVLTKIALATVGLPGLHMLSAWQATALRRLFESTADAQAIADHWHRLAFWLAVALLGALVLLWLGRHKPRLGRRPRKPAGKGQP